MGLIDSKKAIEALTHWETEPTDEEIIYTINNLPTVEAISKADYEAKLKADMVAMLEEFDLQFDKICFYKNMGEWKTVPEIKAEYKAIIREKINSLKAESEPQESEET